MYGEKVKLRVIFLLFSILIAILVVFLVLKTLEEDVVYFISPTEIKNLPEINSKKINDKNNNLNLTFLPYMFS